GITLNTVPDLILPQGARRDMEAMAAHVMDPYGDALGVFARLKPGVTIDQAFAALSAQWSQIKDATIPPNAPSEARQEHLNQPLLLISARHGADQWERTQALTQALPLVTAGGLLVLLVAALNLASLMLSRVAVSAHEWTVRAALGASRWQLARPVLL